MDFISNIGRIANSIFSTTVVIALLIVGGTNFHFQKPASHLDYSGDGVTLSQMIKHRHSNSLKSGENTVFDVHCGGDILSFPILAFVSRKWAGQGGVVGKCHAFFGMNNIPEPPPPRVS